MLPGSFDFQRAHLAQYDRGRVDRRTSKLTCDRKWPPDQEKEAERMSFPRASSPLGSWATGGPRSSGGLAGAKAVVASARSCRIDCAHRHPCPYEMETTSPIKSLGEVPRLYLGTGKALSRADPVTPATLPSGPIFSPTPSSGGQQSLPLPFQSVRLARNLWATCDLRQALPRR